ncbi:MAG: hypothetical protein ACLTCQ_04625 [Enterocloster bolteae]
MPSKPDKSSRTGYRDTVKPITKEFREELHGAILGGVPTGDRKVAGPDCRRPAGSTPGKGFHQGPVGGQNEEGGKGERRPSPKGEASEGGGAVTLRAKLARGSPAERRRFHWQEKIRVWRGLLLCREDGGPLYGGGR